MYSDVKRGLAGFSAALAATTMLTVCMMGTASGQNISLDTVVVDQQRPDRLRTEGQDTYNSPRTTVGGKENLDVREIPQSVSVVTRQRMDDQNLNQLEDVMRNTAGGVILQNDTGRSSIFIRGYETDVLVNGLYAPNSSILGTQIDMFMFDRVEVLKGPAGLYFGGTSGNNSGPGGVINLVRKSPLDHFQALANVSYGSWSNKRIELDVTSPLNEAKTVRARLVGAFQDRDTFVDLNHNQVWFGYGTIDVDFTENTTFSFSLWRQERDILPFNGLPMFATNPITYTGVPRSTFVGASWNRFDNWSNEYLAELTHRLQNGGHIKAAVRYTDRFIDYKYVQAASGANPATGVITGGLSLTAGRWWEQHLSTDLHLSTPFQLFGQTHNFVIGAEYKAHDLTQYAPTSTAVGGGPYNIYSFNPYSVPEPADTLNNRTNQNPSQYGIYSQLRLKPVDGITLIGGGRLSYYEARTLNLVTNAVTNTIDINGQVTPYGGIVLDLTKNISAYASYTSIFAPQTERDAGGNLIDPREGVQYEAGLKGSFMGGRLNTSFALFEIRDNNRALAVTGMPGVFVNAGQVAISGYEFEISGKLTPEWEVYAGYTNLKTQFLSGGTGDFRTYQPRHVFNVWNKYTFLDGPLTNFHIGLGGRYVSEFYTGTTPAARVSEDGYIVADMQIGYKVSQNVQGTFTITNLFDEVYYSRVGSVALFNFYGEPRAWNLKVSTKW